MSVEFLRFGIGLAEMSVLEDPLASILVAQALHPDTATTTSCGVCPDVAISRSNLDGHTAITKAGRDSSSSRGAGRQDGRLVADLKAAPLEGFAKMRRSGGEGVEDVVRGAVDYLGEVVDNAGKGLPKAKLHALSQGCRAECNDST